MLPVKWLDPSGSTAPRADVVKNRPNLRTVVENEGYGVRRSLSERRVCVDEIGHDDAAVALREELRRGAETRGETHAMHEVPILAQGDQRPLLTRQRKVELSGHEHGGIVDRELDHGVRRPVG